MVDPYEVVMPKLGLIMTEANLLEWFKGDGESIKKGEKLFSFESDKSVVEIESPASGIVQTLIEVGTTVPIKTPIAIIYPEGAKISASSVVSPPKKINQTMDSTRTFPQLSGSQSQHLRATPKARILARTRGIDLHSLSGSGLRGMIVTSDLDKVPKVVPPKATPVAQKMATAFGIELHKITGTGPGGRITRDDISAAITGLAKGAIPGSKQVEKGREPLPLKGLRSVIAERLSASWNERPQVTLHSEVDATNLTLIRDQKRNSDGKKITFNAYFVAAASRALAEFPEFNSQLTETGMVQFQSINIGLAIDTERGLVVPVLKDVGKLSLQGIEAGLTDLIERTLKDNTIPEDFSGGTFTITNLGAFGIDSFTPIINPPEIAILGLGRIHPKVVAVGDMVGIRQMVTLNLSFDHRLVDGAPAARFSQHIGHYIENPDGLH